MSSWLIHANSKPAKHALSTITSSPWNTKPPRSEVRMAASRGVLAEAKRRTRLTRLSKLRSSAAAPRSTVTSATVASALFETPPPPAEPVVPLLPERPERPERAERAERHEAPEAPEAESEVGEDGGRIFAVEWKVFGYFSLNQIEIDWVFKIKLDDLLTGKCYPKEQYGLLWMPTWYSCGDLIGSGGVFFHAATPIGFKKCRLAEPLDPQKQTNGWFVV